MSQENMLRGNVERTLINDFLKIANRRHGPVYGWKGKGLSEALKLYIRTYGE